MKSLIDNFFEMQDEVFKYFGYKPDWKVIPLDPQLERHWMICGPEDKSSTSVVYSDKPFTQTSVSEGSTIYSGTIYTQRFLPKWVYRGEDYTMVAVDTHTDGNQMLMIFENKLECTDQKLKDVYNASWGVMTVKDQPWFLNK
jgi:hypothetical protein